MIATIIEVGDGYVAVDSKQGAWKVAVSPLIAFSVGEQVIFGPSELHEMVLPKAKPVSFDYEDADGNRGSIPVNPQGLWGIPDTAPEYTSDGQHRDSLRQLPGLVNKLPGAPLKLAKQFQSCHGVTLRTRRIIDIFGERVLYVDPDDYARLTDDDRRQTEERIRMKLSCPAIIQEPEWRKR